MPGQGFALRQGLLKYPFYRIIDGRRGYGFNACKKLFVDGQNAG
jgi:hypothetical protein